MTDIAVIGAGPKAVALAAKAAVLNQVRHANLNLTLFEPNGVGAAWRGMIGYTDGQQPLCTLAERDLGFPYDRATFRKPVADAMFGQFSWHAFAVRDGAGQAQYDQWVLHGRRPPSHTDFADYLQEAFNRSGQKMVNRWVTSIDFSGGKWKLGTQLGTNIRTYQLFDAVVVTGSGPALPPLPIDPPGATSRRIFDGISFWQRRPRVARILKAEHADDRSIIIIGAGGTAAAIAYWFVRNRIDIPIKIIGREPTLYARHSGFFEDRLFSEEDDWRLLEPASRDEFVKRLTSGVVWDYVLRNLDTDQIRYQCADVQMLKVLTTSSGTLNLPEIQAVTHPTIPPGTKWTGPLTYEPGAIIIDARGFDAWAFTKLLAPPLQAHFAGTTARAAVREGINDALAVGTTALGTPFPPGLHVPMQASRQGPAAPNLMALGWVTDRILRPYVFP